MTCNPYFGFGGGVCNIKPPDKAMVKKVGTDLSVMVAEAGGIAIGFLGAGFIGNFIESSAIGKPATDKSPAFDKLKGLLANNGSKVGIFLLMRMFTTGYILDGIQKAVAGSVLIDIVIRASTGWASPPINPFGCNADVGIFKLSELHDNVQENVRLRNELNNVLQRLSQAQQPIVQTSPVVNTVHTSPSPVVDIRPVQVNTPPVVVMNKENKNSDANVKDLASKFGML